MDFKASELTSPNSSFKLGVTLNLSDSHYSELKKKTGLTTRKELEPAIIRAFSLCDNSIERFDRIVEITVKSLRTIESEKTRINAEMGNLKALL